MEDTSKNQNTDEKKENEETNSVPTENMMKFSRRDKKGDAIKEVWDFCDKQPVPKFNSSEIKEEDIGPIDKNTNLEAERKEPFNLPKNHVWYELNINKEEELTKVLLSLNFQINYSYTNFLEITTWKMKITCFASTIPENFSNGI